MLRFMDEPWAKHPEVLIKSLGDCYRQAIKAGKVESSPDFCRKKIMAYRGYCSAVPQDKLLKAVEDLLMVYIPKSIPPGPGFLFAVCDATEDIKMAQVRVCDETVYGCRYLSLVDKYSFIGPAWVGMDQETMTRILDSRSVLVVEGPFDILAVKTLVPECPVLCPLTKSLNMIQRAILRILGVNRIVTLWDSDATGQRASSRGIMGFQTLALHLPRVKDPSDALLNYNTMCELQDLIRSVPKLPAGDTDDD